MPRYTLFIEDETYQRVQAQARSDDRSVAWMLRRLLAEALDTREKEST